MSKSTNGVKMRQMDFEIRPSYLKALGSSLQAKEIKGGTLSRRISSLHHLTFITPLVPLS
jgi:hypothetical protein